MQGSDFASIIYSRGEDTSVPKINLDPKKRPKEVLTVFRQVCNLFKSVIFLSANILRLRLFIQNQLQVSFLTN